MKIWIPHYNVLAMNASVALNEINRTNMKNRKMVYLKLVESLTNKFHYELFVHPINELMIEYMVSYQIQPISK